MKKLRKVGRRKFKPESPFNSKKALRRLIDNWEYEKEQEELSEKEESKLDRLKLESLVLTADEQSCLLSKTEILSSASDKITIKFSNKPIQGIYFLILEGEIIYVGQSVNITGRVLSHLQVKVFDSFSYVTIDDKTRLSAFEVSYIWRTFPALNKAAMEPKSLKQIALYASSLVYPEISEEVLYRCLRRSPLKPVKRSKYCTHEALRWLAETVATEGRPNED